MHHVFAVVLNVLLFALPLSLIAQQPPTVSPGDQTASQQPSEKPGAIRGRVIAADTGAGLRRARVMLRGSDSRPTMTPQTAQTNENGEYEIRDVKAGRYTMTVMRNGYVSQTYGQKSADPMARTQGTQLTVRPGEALSKVDFQMIRGGAVEGQITDQNNEPISRVMVQLSRYRTMQGKRTLMPVSMGQTDDRGHFRLFEVPPGNYYLSATYRSFGFPDGGGGGAFPPTYYPGALSPQEASKIQIAPAAEITGINLALTEMVSFIVSGKVMGSDGKPASGARLMSMRHPPETDFMMFGGAGVDVDGTFKLSNMLPGKYRLTASTTRDGKTQSGSAIVEVGNEDLQNVMLILGTGAEVSGKIVVEGTSTQSLEPRQIRVMLVPDGGPMMGGFFGGGPEETKDDLTFRQTVSEGSSRFNVTLPSGNYYLKSVRMEGRDVTDQAIDFRNSDRYHGVEVVISTQGGQLSGVVRKEEGGEVLRGATVVLFSADPERQSKPRFTKTVQTDQQGSFVAKGIVPGEYVVCALLSHEGGAESDPSYLKEIEKLGKRVGVAAGATKTEDLVAAAGPTTE